MDILLIKKEFLQLKLNFYEWFLLQRVAVSSKKSRKTLAMQSNY